MANDYYTYVNYDGAIYRISPRNWRRYLKDLIEDKEKHIEEYGIYVCYITCDIVNMDAERARNELDYLKTKEK